MDLAGVAGSSGEVAIRSDRIPAVALYPSPVRVSGIAALCRPGTAGGVPEESIDRLLPDPYRPAETPSTPDAATINMATARSTPPPEQNDWVTPQPSIVPPDGPCEPGLEGL